MNATRLTALIWAFACFALVPSPAAAAPQGHGPGHDHGDAAADDPAKPQSPVLLRGRVLGATGEPLADAGLAVFPESPDPRATRKKPLVKTGADGKFELTVERPNAATPSILVSAKGHACMQFLLKGEETEVAGKKVYLVEAGDVALPAGVDMTGLVRGEDRKPIAGATVRARSVVTDYFPGGPRSPKNVRRIMTAKSDSQGVVVLIGMPQTGVAITVEAAGYNSESLPYVNRHLPMVVTLATGGEIRGKVVDAAGKPVAKARVLLYSEVNSGSSSATTDEDGAFSFPFPSKGRARIRYSARLEEGGKYVTGWSELLTGPVGDMVLKLEGGGADAAAERGVAKKPRTRADLPLPKKAKRTNKLVFRAVDAETGVAPKKLKAALLWWQPNMWEHNPGYLERQLRDAKIDEQGRVELSGPSQGQPLTGRAMLVAEGYAPVTIKDLEWSDEGQNPEVPVKLLPEAKLELTVQDTTGKPVVGAKLLCTSDNVAVVNYVPPPMRRRLQSRFGSSPSGMPTTDKDGKVTIRSLAYGTHFLHLAHSEYADADPLRLDLKPGANVVVMKIDKGASLFGKVVGVQVLSGWQVRIQRLQAARTQYSSYSSLTVEQASEFVPIAEDGTFAIHGLTKANYDLALVMRGGGGSIEIPIGPFRIRSKDLRLEFDVSEELPGTVKGRITVRGAPLPPGRLLLLASLQGSQPRSYYSGRPNYFGHRVPVGPSGRFETRLPEGLYNLQVLDVATGVILYQAEKGTRVRPLKTHSVDLRLDVAAVTVKLVPEREGGTVAINRLEIRATHPKLPGSPNRNMFFGGNDQYRGVGQAIRLGATEVDLVLPCVPVKLLARSDAHNLDPSVQSYNFPAQGDVEIEPKSGEQSRVEIRVSEPQINLDKK